MKEFQIWSEGFIATGENGHAMLHATVKAIDFREACDKLAEKSRDFREYYDKTNLTYWGCKLFDNEKDARKRYG
jgi:hypothetical protein